MAHVTDFDHHHQESRQPHECADDVQTLLTEEKCSSSLFFSFSGAAIRLLTHLHDNWPSCEVGAWVVSALQLGQKEMLLVLCASL